MADGFSIKFDTKIAGERIQRVARSLPAAKVEPILLQAATILRDAARRNAPFGPPHRDDHSTHLRAAIMAKTLKRVLNNPAPAIAAVDRKLAPHAHLVEFGSAKAPSRVPTVRVGKKGDRRYIGREFGVMPAQPFMRPAWDTNRNAIYELITDRLADMIIEAAKPI